MKNKYPFIKDNEVIIGPKFIGDKDRTLDLNKVQQFMGSLEIYDKLALLKAIATDEMDMYYANQIEEIIKSIKPYLP